MSSQQEKDTLSSIKLIGYQGALLNDNELRNALQEGPKSIEFTKLVHFLTSELRTLCNLDECVNAITAPEDSVAFVMEISSFLKELGCPYVSLTQGHVSDRLSSSNDCLQLIDHLVGELIAARILRETRPEKKMELKLQESSHAADLRKILQTLSFSRPPPNLTMQMLFQKLTPSVENAVKKAGPDLLGTQIFNGTLSEKQWETLSNVNKELHDDYMVRREMLLKRLDCTIQSFQWSDKTKGKEKEFESAYSEKRKLLKAEPEVDLSDLLASRDDIAVIEKTSSALVRKNTTSSVNKVIIGQVPDRGGRTSEQAPPPPEMPAWQQRTAGPPSGQRGQFRGSSNYSRGGRQQNYRNDGGNRNYNNYQDNAGYSGGQSQSFDSAGSYSGDNYNQNARGNQPERGYRGSGAYDGDNYNQNARGNQQERGYRGSGAYDSAGSYGGYSQDHQEPKRARTFDDFQQNRTSYADQYVQESQHNQQYHSRDNRNRGGRGRSSYHRGGGGRNYR